MDSTLVMNRWFNTIIPMVEKILLDRDYDLSELLGVVGSGHIYQVDPIELKRNYVNFLLTSMTRETIMVLMDRLSEHTTDEITDAYVQGVWLTKENFELNINGFPVILQETLYHNRDILYQVKTEAFNLYLGIGFLLQEYKIFQTGLTFDMTLDNNAMSVIHELFVVELRPW